MAHLRSIKPHSGANAIVDNLGCLNNWRKSPSPDTCSTSAACDHVKELVVSAERAEGMSMGDLLPLCPTLIADLVATTQCLRWALAAGLSELLEAHRTLRLIVFCEQLDLALEILQYANHGVVVSLGRLHHVVDEPDPPM